MLNDSSSAHSMPKYSRQYSLEHVHGSSPYAVSAPRARDGDVGTWLPREVSPVHHICSWPLCFVQHGTSTGLCSAPASRERAAGSAGKTHPDLPVPRPDPSGLSRGLSILLRVLPKCQRGINSRAQNLLPLARGHAFDRRPSKGGLNSTSSRGEVRGSVAQLTSAGSGFASVCHKMHPMSVGPC